MSFTSTHLLTSTPLSNMAFSQGDQLQITDPDGNVHIYTVSSTSAEGMVITANGTAKTFDENGNVSASVSVPVYGFVPLADEDLFTLL